MATNASGAMDVNDNYKTFNCTPEVLVPIHATRHNSPRRMIKDFTHITRHPTNELHGTNSPHTTHTTHQHFPKHVSISKIGDSSESEKCDSFGEAKTLRRFVEPRDSGNIEIRCKCGFVIETNTNRLIHCGIAFDDMHRHTMKCTK